MTAGRWGCHDRRGDLNERDDHIDHQRELDADPEVKGVVVTHGTSTPEPSTYFVDLCYRGGTRLVFTGAMRNPSRAPTAGEHPGRGPGFDGGVRGRDGGARGVQRPGSRDTLGHEGPRHRARDLPHARVRPPRRDRGGPRDVAGARTPPRSAWRPPERGFHPDVIPALRDRREAGVPLVATTRCPEGRIGRETSDFPGSHATLRELGAHFSDLNLSKTRVRAIVALAADRVDDAFVQA